jgi:AAA domain
VTPFYGRDYDDDGNPVPEIGPQVVSLGDVEPEHVEWLWADYLPLGKLVVLDGDPGVGKSTVSLDIAARVSTGSPMPDGSAGAKGAVLILSAEDGLADTIRPRIDAASGDPAQIIAMTGITYATEDGVTATRPPQIPRDLAAVEQTVREHRVALVIVDVLMAYLGGDVNSHHDQDIRRALHPLAAMAERCACCVLVLRHLNKSSGASAVYRGGGSIGIIGAARAGFMCGTDPEDESRRVLAPVKVNLSAEPPALAYQLVPDELRGCVRIRWLGESGRKAWELLSDQGGDDERGQQAEAAEWLTGYLTDHGGEDRAGEIIKAAGRDGIAARTLQRARSKAGVITGHPTFGGGWVWRFAASKAPPKAP